MAASDKQPRYSVVIPTYGRGAALARCLDSLAALRAPAGGFEVVVVDDGGPEPLDSIVQAHARDLDIAAYRKTNGGPASARNFGAARARGAYLVFTDDDCAPAADWLAYLAASLGRYPRAMVGGYTRNALPDAVYTAASQALVDYLYTAGRIDPTDMAFITSNNMALPAAGFAALGGFDERYPRAAGEDRDLCDRWRAAGRRIVYTPRAIIGHYHALDFRDFWRQHSNYGRGAYHVHQSRARQRQSQPRLEKLSFYMRLIGYPFTGGYRRPWRIAMLLAVAQVATTAGLAAEAWAGYRRR